MAHKFTLSAPSYVLPASIEENSLFLKDYVKNVYIALFERAACLAYTQKDIPFSLSELGLDYHVHFPLDLTWENKEKDSWDLLQLVEKVAFLKPKVFVLHPPAHFQELYFFSQQWLEKGLSPRALCIENIKGRDLALFWEVIRDFDLGICLDIGHLLAYEQENILILPNFWEHVEVIHLYGREIKGKHTSLLDLPKEGWALLREALARLEQKLLVLEVFNKKDFLDSYELLWQNKEELGVEFV